MKYTLHIGLVALLAASAACSSNSNPMSPSATTGAGNVSAVPEGTPTLKANTPGSPSPSSGQTTELGPQNTIPVTLSVSNAVATHANTVALGHRFQLFEGSSAARRTARARWRRWPHQLDGDDAAEVRHDVHVAGPRGADRWLRRLVRQLDVQDAGSAGLRRAGARPIRHRARACRCPTARAWSTRRTPSVRTSSAAPARTDGGTWEFMDYLVDKLREEDNRWGYNGKRGNANDPSQDIVDYHWGAGPSDGSTQVYIIDIMLSHCGSPAPAWIDQTGVTAQQGTVGRWTGRGRFVELVAVFRQTRGRLLSWQPASCRFWQAHCRGCWTDRIVPRCRPRLANTAPRRLL